MREVKIYCDHCGKVLNEMKDYVDTEINAHTWFKTDLCDKCIKDLDRIVREFCGKKDGGEK